MADAVEFLKQNIDVEQLLRYYDTKHLHVSNGQIRSCCPIHKGNNPTAFVFNLKNNLWFCHTSCKTGGDIYDLVQIMEHIDFPSSVRKIAEMFGIDISDMTITMRTNKVLQDTKRFVESMRRMLDIREIEPYDISVLGELHQINSYRHFDKETLNYFGVKYCTYAEIQREDKRPLIINKRIVVPIYNNGTIVGVTMRRTDNNPIKWIHQPDGLITGNTLYNIDNIKQSDTESIIVCEGVWDVMNYYQNGYPNAVATFGCHLTEQQERILLQNTYNVILSYDMDEAGISGAIKVISRLKNKVNIRIANIPNGKDAGELNVDEINHTLAHSLSILEFNERVGLSAKQGNSNIRRRI